MATNRPGTKLAPPNDALNHGPFGPVLEPKLQASWRAMPGYERLLRAVLAPFPFVTGNRPRGPGRTVRVKERPPTDLHPAVVRRYLAPRFGIPDEVWARGDSPLDVLWAVVSPGKSGRRSPRPVRPLVPLCRLGVFETCQSADDVLARAHKEVDSLLVELEGRPQSEWPEALGARAAFWWWRAPHDLAVLALPRAPLGQLARRGVDVPRVVGTIAHALFVLCEVLAAHRRLREVQGALRGLVGRDERVLRSARTTLARWLSPESFAKVQAEFDQITTSLARLRDLPTTPIRRVEWGISEKPLLREQPFFTPVLRWLVQEVRPRARTETEACHLAATLVNGLLARSFSDSFHPLAFLGIDRGNPVLRRTPVRSMWRSGFRGRPWRWEDVKARISYDPDVARSKRQPKLPK